MDDIIATDKQIERILQQIAVIPEQVADGIVVIDLAGTVRFFNPAWVAMHGCDATEELIGRHISEFHTEEQMKTLVADFIEETKRRGQLAGPVEHMRGDGTVFCSQTKMTTVRDKEGKTIGLVVFATNTTRPTHAQRHLSDQTTELTAANQQLQHQITEHEDKVNELKEQGDQLELRLNQQNTELTAVKEQLQDEIAERQQIQQRLKQQVDELITALATNEQLKHQIAELTAANNKLQNEVTMQKQAENALKEDREQLEQEIARRRQAKENLTQLQARLNILLVNVCKLNQELSLTCLKKGNENQKV